MSYDPTADYFLMSRGNNPSQGLRMPILDAIMEALALGGVYTMVAGNVAPVTNQATTLWLNTAIPSYSQQGVLMAWNGTAYVVATPALVLNAALVALNGVGAVDGNVIANNYGGAPPANTVGLNGDWALDTSTGTLYGPKAGGVWPPTGQNVDPAAFNLATAANATANTALTDAETALTNAAAAQSTANSALAAAGAAQTTANTAVTNAAAAQTTANTALANANQALAEIAALPGVGPLNTITGNSGGTTPVIGATNGDYFIDYSTGDIYGPYASSAWPPTPVYTPAGAAANNPFRTTNVGATLLLECSYVCDNTGATGISIPLVIGASAALTNISGAIEGAVGGGSPPAGAGQSFLTGTYAGAATHLYTGGYDVRWSGSAPPGTWEVAAGIGTVGGAAHNAVDLEPGTFIRVA